MYLSYSGYKLYEQCGLFYWHRYVNQTELTAPENCANSLYGSLVGLIYEDFYKNKRWRSPNIIKDLTDLIPNTYTTLLEKELKRNVLKWKKEDPSSSYKSEADMLADVYATIPRGIEIIRHHRLLGPESDAEVKLDSWIEGHQVGGRSDFIILRVKPDGDRVIIDGKGSKYRDRYVDPLQLKWYALLHQEKFGTLPDKIGFVYWRSEPAQALDWIPFSDQSIAKLRVKIVQTMDQIDAGVKKLKSLPLVTSERELVMREVFSARPGECKRCPYSDQCRVGQAFLSKLTEADNLHEPEELRGVGALFPKVV